MRYLCVVLLSVSLLGCDKREEIIGASVDSLPAVVELKVGKSVHLSQEGITITFLELTQDSRCPIGAICVWQGDANPHFLVEAPPANPIHCILHTALDPKSATAGSVVLTLQQVSPYPIYDTPIDPSSYVVTIEIRRVVR
jgi:hypothetical protein